MAGNEGTSQTELWSSVVHQPCEEPEESELPSTVDMAAFSTGLSVEPTNTSQNNDNTDSDSDSEPDSSVSPDRPAHSHYTESRSRIPVAKPVNLRARAILPTRTPLRRA
jgi:hypothetical protein